jgi:hypothetical protein
MSREEGKSKKKKTDKAKVPANKISTYWGFRYPRNMAKRAIRVYKRVLSLTKDKDKAALEAQRCADVHVNKGVSLAGSALNKYIHGQS